MIAQTAMRVAEHTPPRVNRRIQRQSERNISFYRDHPEAIHFRLQELDGEWDIERAIETWSAGLSLVGLGLAATVHRKFIAMPIIIQLFMLQHAVQGWCPPLSVMRRLGLRTAREIEDERRALIDIQSQRSDSRRTQSPINRKIDVVDEASEESFPASDPPAW